MKSYQSGFRAGLGTRLLGTAVAAVFLISGCVGLSSDSNSSESRTRNEEPREAETATRSSRTADRGSSNYRSQPVGPLRELDEQAVFYLAYNVAFYAGGFWTEEHDFEESEGIRWSIEARDSSGSHRIEAARALLRWNTDGTSWWYLSYGDRSRTFTYEVLLDDSFSPITMVYEQPGTATPVRSDINYEEFGHDLLGDGGMDAEAQRQLERFGVTELVFLSPEDLRSRRRSTGTTDVPAGRFPYEHVQYTMPGIETAPENYYEWWFSDEVPGGMIRYEWRQEGSNRFFRGELVDIDTGYTTQYGVF